jgi:cell fate (sporulation/competence/biofilm development) regulator YlbF (YheA/YmcA/DUF963 family)
MDPFKIAEELGEAILASEEYKDFETAKAAMDNNDEAISLVESFQDHQQLLRDGQLTGKKITQEQIAELHAYQRKMMENKEISTYLEAKKKVDNLLAAVHQVVNQVTGLDSGHSHGGGCGGGCC